MKYEAFIQKTGLDETDFKSAWAFGNDENIGNMKLADELASLVLEGKKTATASALLDYEPDEQLPEVDGKFELILNGKGEPVAAIKLTKVYVKKFNQVSEAHAYKEGEGDRSLNYWREVHEKFWRDINLFSNEMDVVCEEFELLYPKIN